MINTFGSRWLFRSQIPWSSFKNIKYLIIFDYWVLAYLVPKFVDVFIWFTKLARVCGLEKSRTTLNGSKTPLQVILTSGSNPELVVAVKGEWEYKESLLLEDVTLLLLFVYFLCVWLVFFFSINRKSRFALPGKLTCKTNICFNKYTFSMGARWILLRITVETKSQYWRILLLSSC